MYLIVGLGNIGRQYQLTRHNIGFEAVDYYADRHGIQINKEGLKGAYGQGIICGQKTILVKPQTYMNLSGECVQAFAHYYDVPLHHLIVIHDDIEFKPGVIRIRKKGSGGTHNGMRNIVQLLGSGDFPRVRIGVGNNPRMELMNYVLGRFLPEEMDVMREAVMRTADILDEYLTHGIDSAMNHFNVRKKKEEEEPEDGKPV